MNLTEWIFVIASAAVVIAMFEAAVVAKLRGRFRKLPLAIEYFGWLLIVAISALMVTNIRQVAVGDIDTSTNDFNIFLQTRVLLAVYFIWHAAMLTIRWDQSTNITQKKTRKSLQQ